MATAEIKAVITADDQASSVLANFGKSIAGIGVPLAAVGGAITAFGVMAVNSFNDSQLVGAQLNSVLKSTGGIAGVTADEINKLSSSLQKTTRFSDEQIGSAQNMLLTFTNIGKNVFPDTTKAVLDMATAMGTDLKSTAIQVGKAMQDPTLGAAALQRVGVRLTDSQKDLVKSLQDTGDMAGAQAIILGELQREFGGSAEAAGKTFAGQLDIARNSLDDIMESIGGVIAEGLTPFVEKLKPLVAGIQSFIEKNPDLVRSIVGVTAAVGLASLALGGLAIAIGIVETIGAPLILIGLAIIAAITAIAFAANYVAEKMGGWGVVMQMIGDIYNTYLKPPLMDLWNTIQTQLLPVLKEFWDQNKNWIVPALKDLGVIIGVYIVATLLIFIQTIKFTIQIVSALIGGLNSMTRAWSNSQQAVYNFVSNMGALIGGLWNRAAGGFNDFNRNAIQWAMNTVNSIVRFFQDLPGRISGAIGNTGNAVGKALRIPGFAAGTSNFSGGMAIVGERGPELVNLPRGADVIPNNKIASVGGSGSTTININVGLMTGSAIERREAATRMFEDLKDIAGQRGQTVGQMIGA
jgi:hypothetical protein